MDIFSTGALARVVSELPQPAPFILNSFFREVQTEDSEEIHFDVANGRRRISPFVSPVVAGKVVHSKGYTAKTFSPAYVKDKRVFNPNRAFKRAMGEKIGGTLSNIQRMSIALANDLVDQTEMLTRRQELMAVEALRTGKVIVEGDDYPRSEVDFGRASGLTKALTLALRWGESGVSPLDNLRTWSLEVAKESGATANVAVMDVKAYALFAADPAVQKELDRFRGQAALNPTVVGEGGRYMGRVGDFDIWVYTGWYEDPTTKVVTAYMPDHTVILTGPDLEGVRCYGAIQDEKAGIQAMPYFAKSWTEEDPSARMLMMQSAPLPVPYRVNASMCATVR
jgi:hypothetical protein